MKGYVGEQGFKTGDIKLASVLMSMGIPLDQKQPASLNVRDTGGSYASFHLLAQSVDGKHGTRDLMEFWSHPEKAPTGHPMKALLAFVKDAPQGVSHANDWLEHAHQWLGRLKQRPPDAPRRLEDIPDFVERHPNDLSGYVFSFPYNRDTCWKEYLRAKESPDYLLNKGKAWTRVNHRTPKRIADELISRLNG